MSAASFDRYLASLVASWQALAAAQPAAVVVQGPGFIAAHFAEPVLNNAVVLSAAAVSAAAKVYADGEHHALWSRDDDQDTAAALVRRGYLHSETTRPMLCRLAGLDHAAGPPVSTDADPERIAELNGVPPHLLRGVPGLWAYATERYDAVLVLLPADTDVNVSFVWTRPAVRGCGLATAVLRAALLDARQRGAHTASLQSTPMAERLYTRLGFEPVGRWQEWSPAG